MQFSCTHPLWYFEVEILLIPTTLPFISMHNQFLDFSYIYTHCNFLEMFLIRKRKEFLILSYNLKMAQFSHPLHCCLCAFVFLDHGAHMRKYLLLSLSLSICMHPIFSLIGLATNIENMRLASCSTTKMFLMTKEIVHRFMYSLFSPANESGCPVLKKYHVAHILLSRVAQESCLLWIF